MGEELTWEVINIQATLAKALVENKQIARGLDLHRRNIAAARQLSKDESTVELFEALNSFGYSLYNIDNFQEAQAIFREALEVVIQLDEENVGEQAELIESCQMSLAAIAARRGQTKQAVTLNQAAISSALERNGGRDNDHTAYLRFNLANCLLAHGHHEEGLLNLEWAIEALKKVCEGSSSFQLCAALKTAYGNFASPYVNPEKAQIYKAKWEEAKQRL